MNKQNILWGIAGLALVLSIIGLVGGHNQSASGVRLSGVTNYDSLTLAPTNATEGLKVGTTTPSQFASTLNLVYATSSAFLIANASITASTTANVDAAVVGVQPGDFVVGQLTASSTLASQFIVKGVVASSTAGFVTFSIYNATGGSLLPATTNGFGSSTQVWIFRVRN